MPAKQWSALSRSPVTKDDIPAASRVSVTKSLKLSAAPDMEPSWLLLRLLPGDTNQCKGLLSRSLYRVNPKAVSPKPPALQESKPLQIQAPFAFSNLSILT